LSSGNAHNWEGGEAEDDEETQVGFYFTWINAEKCSSCNRYNYSLHFCVSIFLPSG